MAPLFPTPKPSARQLYPVLQPIENEQIQAFFFAEPDCAHASQSFQDASVLVFHNWLAAQQPQGVHAHGA